ADFAALQKRLDQVDHLDARLEHLFVRGLLVEQWRRTVNGHARLFADGPKLVYRLADHVDHAPQCLLAHGHADRPAKVDSLHAAHHALRSLHGHRAHAPLAQVLLHFQHHVDRRGHVETVADHAKRLVNGRHRRLFKLHVHGRAGDLNHFANVFCHFYSFEQKIRANSPFRAIPNESPALSRRQPGLDRSKGTHGDPISRLECCDEPRRVRAFHCGMLLSQANNRTVNLRLRSPALSKPTSVHAQSALSLRSVPPQSYYRSRRQNPVGSRVTKAPHSHLSARHV